MARKTRTVRSRMTRPRTDPLLLLLRLRITVSNAPCALMPPIQAVPILSLTAFAAFLFGRFMRSPRVQQSDRDAVARESAHWDSLEEIYRRLLERVAEMDQEQTRLDKEIKVLGAAVQRLEAGYPRQAGID